MKLFFVGLEVASKGFLGRRVGVSLIQLTCEGDFAGP